MFMGNYDRIMKEFRGHYRLDLPYTFPKFSSLSISIEAEEGIPYLSLVPSDTDNVRLLWKGRKVSLPKLIADASGIGQEVSVIGCGSYFEIWNRRQWEEYINGAWEQYAAMLEAV